jgi:hypothetical protein
MKSVLLCIMDSYRFCFSCNIDHQLLPPHYTLYNSNYWHSSPGHLGPSRKYNTFNFHICGLLNFPQTPNHWSWTSNISTGPQLKQPRKHFLFFFICLSNSIIISPDVSSALCQPNDYFVPLKQRKVSNKIHDLQLALTSILTSRTLIPSTSCWLHSNRKSLLLRCSLVLKLYQVIFHPNMRVGKTNPY